MFDTVDDLILFITEDNVAVFSHDLHNQIFGTQITGFIQMFNSKTDDPVSYTHLDVYKRQELLSVYLDKQSFPGVIELYRYGQLDGESLADISHGIIVSSEYREAL